jgi:hypothetical protein
MTDFLQDFYDRKRYYLTFFQKKGEESLKTRFISEFTKEFSKIWQKVEQHLEFWWELDPPLTINQNHQKEGEGALKS